MAVPIRSCPLRNNECLGELCNWRLTETRDGNNHHCGGMCSMKYLALKTPHGLILEKEK